MSDASEPAPPARNSTGQGGRPTLYSRRTSGLPVQYIEVDDDIDEAMLARHAIEQHLHSGVEPSIAVLARTHTLLEGV
ncbi:MAG: hypothetical protein ACKOE7_10790, partial [Actinomycetota bacterium]